MEVDSVKTPSPTPIWVRIGNDCDLLPEDKVTIEAGGWLNDRIVGAWQYLLKKTHPHINGLHPTVLLSKRKYKKGQKFKQGLSYEVVQVMNSGDSHWVAFSNVGCAANEVLWMDSMHCAPSSRQEVIIADLVQCNEAILLIHVCNVQLQMGSSDWAVCLS